MRIGTKERTAAMQALDEHLDEGRLGAEEYGERSARASTATTADELRALFTDLPQPHPVLPGDAAPVLPAAAAAPVPAQRGFLEQWGPKLAVLTPLIVVGLFLLTRQPWLFAFIPLVFIMLRGGHRKRH